jgi:hypothetical protein
LHAHRRERPRAVGNEPLDVLRLGFAANSNNEGLDVGDDLFFSRFFLILAGLFSSGSEPYFWWKITFFSNACRDSLNTVLASSPYTRLKLKALVSLLEPTISEVDRLGGSRDASPNISGQQSLFRIYIASWSVRKIWSNPQAGETVCFGIGKELTERPRALTRKCYTMSNSLTGSRWE